MSVTWTGVSDLNIQLCFNKVGFSQLCKDPNSNSLPDPDHDSDVTDEVRALIDGPFGDFINLESDGIIQPVVAEPGILQADANIVPDDYQLDEQLPDSTPQIELPLQRTLTNLPKSGKRQISSVMQN